MARIGGYKEGLGERPRRPVGLAARTRSALRMGGHSVMVALPGKIGYAPASEVAARFGIASVMAAASGTGKISLPDMIDVPGTNIRVAKSIVTGGQIAQLVASGYAIEGNNKDGLIALIRDEANKENGIGCLSKYDGEKLAETIKKQNPGRVLRLPTEKELLAIFTNLTDRVSGLGNYWLWTSDETSENSGFCVLRHLSDAYRVSLYPECRCTVSALLLVEDKK